MKKNRQKLTALILALMAAISILPASVLAVAGTVYFGPDGNTVTAGSEFYVEVRGNVPDPGGIWGGGATIRFTYDRTKLQLISTDDENGVFEKNSRPSWKNEPGIVHYRTHILWNAPGVNNQKIIGAKFKATGTGNTTLSFASSTNVNDGPTTGTSKTFTILPVSCPAGQIGTPPNCSTPPPVPTPKPAPSTVPTSPKTPSPSIAPITPSPLPIVPEPAPDTEITPEPEVDSNGGLAIENVKLSISRQKNTVTWTLNSPDLQPTLSYGTSKANQNSKAEVNKLDDGSFEGEFMGTKPGTLYHFTISAVANDELKNTNYKGTFLTKGYPIQITVKQNGILAPGAKVNIGERNFIADKNATIITELGEGTFDASVTPKESSLAYKTNFVVKNVSVPQNSSPEVQKITLDGTIISDTEVSNDNPLPLILGAIAVISSIGLIGFIVYRKKSNVKNEDQSIDTDILISNYGNALEDARNHTPEPNLDVQATAPSIPSDQTHIDWSQTNPLPPSDELIPDPAPQAPSSIQPPEPPPASDNFTTDQSPSTTQPQDISYPVPTPTTDYSPQQYSSAVSDTTLTQQIDEQLSEQVVAVESITKNSEPEEDTEEAIYHPETGELRILHNKQPPARSDALAAPNQDFQQTTPAQALQQDPESANTRDVAIPADEDSQAKAAII